MIKKLHIKLVLLYTGITGVILALCLAITFFLSCRQYIENQNSQIKNQIESFQNKTIANQRIDNHELQDLEEQIHGAVLILENGTPFLHQHYKKQISDAMLEGLIRFVHGDRSNELSSSMNDWYTTEFVYRDSTASFQVFYYIQDTTTQIEIFAVQDLSYRNSFIQRQAIFYGALLFLGVSLLAIINWWLIRMVLRPVESSVRQQKEFVAAAGHELKTPLASIRAGLDVLQKHMASSPEVEGVFYATQSEALRMSHLVQELLLLANSDMQARKVTLTNLEPDTFCLQLYEKYQFYAKQQEHPLRLKIEDTIYPEIHANEEALTQIGSIFISNAISHTQEKTPIDICCRLLNNGAVELGIRDYGAGIALEDLSKVFDRFYRADQSRSTSDHYGLGLSVAKSLAELQSLQIGVRNMPDGGAMFFVCTQ